MYNLPEYVQTALNTLTDKGYQAFVVGGGLRDIILGNIPDDYDITTSAKPDEILKLFNKSYATGLKHGTVTVVLNNKRIEITTFRSDGDYVNHRSPVYVEFLTDINGDLSRRDFTINALAYNKKDGLIDKFGGINDLNNKIIKAVGSPEIRFEEDALRILRAFRFSAKLGFKIEKKTLNAALNKASLLKFVSKERIFCELSKILISDNPEVISELIKNGGFEFLNIAAATINLKALKNIKPDLRARFYTFCILCNTDAKRLCKTLKTDNKLYDYCNNMDLLFSQNFPINKTDIKKLLYLTDVTAVTDYLEINATLYSKPSLSKILENIIKNNEPYKISHLKITGNDLIGMGYLGENIGIKLEKLLNIVIEKPELNNTNTLIDIIKKSSN